MFCSAERELESWAWTEELAPENLALLVQNEWAAMVLGSWGEEEDSIWVCGASCARGWWVFLAHLAHSCVRTHL